MRKTAPRSAVSAATISLATLDRYAPAWTLDGEIRQHSARTLETRRDLVTKLLWFLRRRGHEECGLLELRGFLAYLNRGHEEPGGRWGSAERLRSDGTAWQDKRLLEPVSARTVETYHGNLRTLFSFLVAEGVLDASPMDGIAAPVVRDDEIQPFSLDQVEALRAAAKRGRYPARDDTMILFLLDTGVRATELAQLKVQNLNPAARSARVLGKGNKERTVHYGAAVSRALFRYHRTRSEAEIRPAEPVFSGERGDRQSAHLTRSGVLQLISRLGEEAQIVGVRCSPHTFRHTFAIEFLRNGGSEFVLMKLLGHTNLTMTRRYVQFARADVQNQHAKFSPADHLGRK